MKVGLPLIELRIENGELGSRPSPFERELKPPVEGLPKAGGMFNMFKLKIKS